MVRSVKDKITRKPTGHSVIEFKSKASAEEALAELDGLKAQADEEAPPTPSWKSKTGYSDEDVARQFCGSKVCINDVCLGEFTQPDDLPFQIGGFV